MIKRNWVRHALSRGQWIHAPQSVQLFRAFEQIVVEKIIRPMGFAEMIFPKLVPWEVWKKSGHAKGVYPEIYYVCTPKTRDPAYWEDVGDYFKVTGRGPGGDDQGEDRRAYRRALLCTVPLVLAVPAGGDPCKRLPPDPDL